MKKIICAVLAAMLIFSAAALADEYTFQTIPWGSSAQEVKAILTERGLIREEDYEAQTVWTIDRIDQIEEVRKEWCSYYPDGSDDNTMWDALVGNVFISGIGSNADLINLSKTIGGHEVADLKLHFLFDIRDGVVVPESHLSMVNVSFKEDENVTSDEMVEKLSVQYGKCEESSVNDYTVCLWKGDNETAVILMYSEGNNNSLWLTYAKTDDYLKVQEMLALSGIKEDAGL